MIEITRWAVLIEGGIAKGDLQRLAGGGDMTYIFNDKKSAQHYRKQCGLGVVVKVTMRVEK